MPIAQEIRPSRFRYNLHNYAQVMSRNVPPRNVGNEPEVVDGLVVTAYDELRRLARGYLSRERIDHTLQPTALVNEAYLRLAGQTRTQWQGRSQFLGIAALLMRRILREHARGRNAGRRGEGASKLRLEDAHDITGGATVEFVAIEEALTTLSKLDPVAAKVVELRFFGGLTIEEISGELDLSPATVKRHWTVARAYLRQRLREASQ
jgi:RNA polymerase sigma-70 factor, ECF subfamily